VQPAALVVFGQVREQVRGFELKCFSEFEFHGQSSISVQVMSSARLGRPS
jgi:hypothetical protein